MTALQTQPAQSPRAGAPSAPARGRDSIRRTARRSPRLAPLLFIGPGMVLFAVLILYPIVQAVNMSLYDWKILAGATSQFLGLGNYIRAFQDPEFWVSLTNAGIYMLLTVPPQIILGLLIAMLLKQKSPTQPLFRVLFYLPVVTSWVVVSLLFKYLFADQGLINFTLGDILHVTSGDTSWLLNRWTALVAISALGIWKGVGWSMMIFLAALQGVPEELEDAARVDGAGWWQRVRSVTLPAIWPSMAFVIVMLVIGGFNVFTSVLLMTGGAPAGQTEVILTYMYKQAFTYLDFGYGSALAVILAVFVFIFSVIQLRVFRGRREAVA